MFTIKSLILTTKSTQVDILLHKYNTQSFREHVCWHLSSGSFSESYLLATYYISDIVVRYVNMFVPYIY